MPSLFVYDRLLDEQDICNYTAEIALLTEHVHTGRCVRLYGRRNFGKTSIVKNVVGKRWEESSNRKIFVYVDLYSVETLQDISMEFTKSLSLALSKKRGLLDKGVDWLKAMTQVRPTWSPSSTGDGFGEFSLKTESGGSIVDFQLILASIDALTRKGKFEFLLVLDEFQEIAKVKQAEAKLRDSLQNLSASTPVVILGSKQHMLDAIFGKPKAPFYSWGLTIELTPISYATYHEYIAERFARVGKTIDTGTTRLIQDLLDRIPESINRFCDHLASSTTATHIDPPLVYLALAQFLDLSGSVYSAQYAAFTTSQRLVLNALAARGRTSQALGRDFMASVGAVSKSGIQTILARFLDDGVIYRESSADTEDAYFVVADPLFRHYIVKYKHLK